jgi:hypothetical protein
LTIAYVAHQEFNNTENEDPLSTKRNEIPLMPYVAPICRVASSTESCETFLAACVKKFL